MPKKKRKLTDNEILGLLFDSLETLLDKDVSVCPKVLYRLLGSEWDRKSSLVLNDAIRFLDNVGHKKGKPQSRNIPTKAVRILKPSSEYEKAKCLFQDKAELVYGILFERHNQLTEFLEKREMILTQICGLLKCFSETFRDKSLASQVKVFVDKPAEDVKKRNSEVTEKDLEGMPSYHDKNDILGPQLTREYLVDSDDWEFHGSSLSRDYETYNLNRVRIGSGKNAKAVYVYEEIRLISDDRKERKRKKEAKKETDRKKRREQQ